MKITTIYDNYKTRKDLEIGWGFSCLIEIDDKKILFDVGEEDKKLFSNMKKLGIDAKNIDILVISHEHWDHTGGLDKIKELCPKIKILMPNSFSKPTEILENVYSTGAMKNGIIGLIEQSLILKTDKGLVIITGCAHPGIVEIIKKAKASLKGDINLVMGGFHLMNMNESGILGLIKEFKNLRVKKVAPSHCTGNKAIELFKEEYGKDFIKNGAGSIIKL